MALVGILPAKAYAGEVGGFFQSTTSETASVAGAFQKMTKKCEGMRMGSKLEIDIQSWGYASTEENKGVRPEFTVEI